MGQEPAIRDTIHYLLHQQQLGVLSTVNDQAPYASLVAYAVSDDDRFLYFVTPRATRKFANLSASPQVALLVNNSNNRPEDFHQAAAVTATGTAKPVTGPQREQILNHYLGKHPYLEDFAHSPSCELVGIRVDRYIIVQRFQNVTEYRIDDEPDPAS